jgi:hypothetical protein
MMLARTTLLIFAVFISHPALAVLPDRPCKVENGRRPPRADEYCDYVQSIRLCDGDSAERLFRQPRNPAYLMPRGGNRGGDMPTRLRCLKETFGDGSGGVPASPAEGGS